MQDPLLTIDKAIVTGSLYAVVGDVVEYTYDLTNNGNVTLTPPFAVNDDRIASVLCPQPATLAVGATIQCTGSYTVNQVDIDNGQVTNVAFATAVDPNSNPVTSETDTETALADQTPGLEITKVDAVDNSVISPATASNVGDIINYTMVVENTGNVTVTAITIDDPNADAGSIACVPALPFVLTVGASANCTATHTITQQDIDAGVVINTAVVSGNDPNNAPVTDDSDDPDDPTNTDPDGDGEPDDPTTAPLTQFPELTLDKQIIGGDPYDSVGDVIDYSYLVTNTGTVTISDITVADDRIASISCPLTVLAPGENMTCGGQYTVVQADLEAGSVINIAEANGIPAGGILTPATDTETAIADQQPAMTLDKAIIGGDPYSTVGDLVQYTYQIVNTGNVTISNLQVTDDRIATVSCPVTTLVPGAQTLCVGSYIVSQADIDAGSVTNIAEATGTPSGGILIPPTDTETAISIQTPLMSIDKTITTGNPYDDIGQSIEYDYLVTNNGNVTIEALTISDDKIATVSCDATILAPGESTHCLGIYITNQDDVDNGSVTNIAEATASTLNGDPVPPVQDTETAFAAQFPSLILDKQLTAGSPYSAVGELLTYTYSLTNDGNVTLSPPFTVNDDRIASINCPADASGIGNGNADLDRGETIFCTATYTIQQSDIDAGSVANVATASALDPTGNLVTSLEDNETAIANANPGLSIDKEITNGSPYDGVGGTDDVVRYSYTVMNVGNQTVTTLQ